MQTYRYREGNRCIFGSSVCTKIKVGSCRLAVFLDADMWTYNGCNKLPVAESLLKGFCFLDW